MKRRSVPRRWVLIVLLTLPIHAHAQDGPYPANGKLKIFVLSGQSNMVGFGQLEGSPGTMETYVKSNLRKYYPGCKGNGYEIVGFGWHQGWNDRINPQAFDAYEANLVNFIKDIRKDLGIAKLPFVIANTGMGGWNIPPQASYKAKVEKLMDAQLALADPEKHPEFAGTVAGVETRDFQRSQEESPSKQGYHWMRNWETYYLIGKAMGDAMVKLAASHATGPEKN